MTTGTARGLWFASPRAAELRSEAVEPPGENEILVRALYSLVSSGTETNVYRGEAVSALEVGLPTRKGEFPFPIQFGYQVVGRVETAGANAEYADGDLVFCQHPHQDRFVVSTDFVYPVVEGLSPRTAAFSNLCNVALNCHLDVPVRIGDCCVVSGLGTIGTFAAHLARRTAGTLVLVDPLAARRRFAQSVGADAVVAPADAAAAIAELSRSRGADVYIEASGAPAALQAAVESTGVEGTVAVISYYGSRRVELTLSPQFHLRRQRIVSSMVGMVGSGLQPRWDKRRQMETAMQLVAGLDVESMITHELPFRLAPEAYGLIDAGADDTLGVLLDYEAEGL
jgi:2-desacetyl-2-hydroxyethyl bacteriochlorophyllide A dehydrogenase